MQRLPGIINIYYVLASSLMASITQKALADAPVGVFADTFLIPHIGDAVCEMETQFDNNDTLEKVKLSFSTTSQLPAREHLAFVIQTVDGKQYLIGTADKPYPVIKVDDSTGKALARPLCLRRPRVGHSLKRATPARFYKGLADLFYLRCLT